MSLVCAVVAASCGNPYVLSGYGSPVTRDGPRRAPHTGVDFKGNVGDPVIAAAPGRVLVLTDNSATGLGILLKHSEMRAEHYTVYLHLSEINVSPGEYVKRGEVIGKVGATGTYAEGVPHVHLQLCTFPCATGTSDGEFAGVEDPLANSGGCFDPLKTYAPDVLTYPIVCQLVR